MYHPSLLSSVLYEHFLKLRLGFGSSSPSSSEKAGMRPLPSLKLCLSSSFSSLALASRSPHPQPVWPPGRLLTAGVPGLPQKHPGTRGKEGEPWTLRPCHDDLEDQALRGSPVFPLPLSCVTPQPSIPVCVSTVTPGWSHQAVYCVVSVSLWSAYGPHSLLFRDRELSFLQSCGVSR